jgi:hypothetical protein
MLRNLNFNPNESYGLYKRLFKDEHLNLQPGSAFRIGNLEFVVERFNQGVVLDIGQRDSQEDSLSVISQLFTLDNKV